MNTMEWALLATFFSTAILIALLYIYVRNYKMLKSKFCTGLIVFAALLLVQNIAAFYFHAGIMERCSYTVAEPILALNVLEMLGLSALFYITWKPCM